MAIERRPREEKGAEPLELRRSPVRIIERYHTGHGYRGRAVWSLLRPLRFVLARAYGAYLVAVAWGGGTGSKRAPVQVGAGMGRGAAVVSIGNIEAGGAGKTPCVITLAERMIDRGGNPVVVTRGYGGTAEHAGESVIVASGRKTCRGGGFATEGELIEAIYGARPRLTMAGLSRALGDEVVLYRQRGIPVVVDPNRKRGVDAAIRHLGATTVLLDDAFQHRAVGRDLDVVLLDEQSPFGNGELLPLGTLRERPEAVRRADVVIFTRSTHRRIPPGAVPLVAGKPVFFASHRPDCLIDKRGAHLPLSTIRGRPVVIFSGIARPTSFEQLVVSVGARPGVSVRFADHHGYNLGDIDSMLRESFPGSVFVTTEKDWVKAAELFPPDVEVLAVRISMEIGGIDELLELVMR